MKRPTNRWGVRSTMMSVGICTGLCVGAWILGGTSEALAEDAEKVEESSATFTADPFLRISLRSYSAFLKDLKQLGELAEDISISESPDLLLRGWLGEEVWNKLNKDAPVGFALHGYGKDSAVGALFVPFADEEILLNFLMDQIEDANIHCREDGVITVSDNFLFNFCLKVANGWTCFSSDEVLFKTPPKPAIEQFGKSQETLSFFFDFDQLSEPLREVLLELWGLDESMVVEDAEEFEEMEPDEQHDYLKNKEALRASRTRMIHWLESFQTCFYGLSFHPETKSLELVGEMNLRPSSEYAQHHKLASETPALFTGFANQNAAFSGHFKSYLNKETIQIQKNDFQKITTQELDEEVSKESQKQTEEFQKIFQEWLEANQVVGVLQGGTVLQYQPETKNWVVGFSSPKPEALDKAFRQWVDLASRTLGEKMDVNGVKYEAEKIEGITFHTWTMATPLLLPQIGEILQFPFTEEDIQLLTRVLGDKTQLVVGFGDGKNFIGVGQSPLPLLRNCLPPAEVSSDFYATCSMKEILALFLDINVMSAESFEKSAQKEDDENSEGYWQYRLDENAQTQSMIKIMQGLLNEDKGKIIFSGDTQEYQSKCRIICEEGVTCLIGSLRMLFSMML